MMGGFLLALIVAIADFYFLFKKLFRVEAQEQSLGKPVQVVNSKKSKASKVEANKKEE